MPDARLTIMFLTWDVQRPLDLYGVSSLIQKDACADLFSMADQTSSGLAGETWRDKKFNLDVQEKNSCLE